MEVLLLLMIRYKQKPILVLKLAFYVENDNDELAFDWPKREYS